MFLDLLSYALQTLGGKKVLNINTPQPQQAIGLGRQGVKPPSPQYLLHSPCFLPLHCHRRT